MNKKVISRIFSNPLTGRWVGKIYHLWLRQSIFLKILLKGKFYLKEKFYHHGEVSSFDHLSLHRQNKNIQFTLQQKSLTCVI